LSQTNPAPRNRFFSQQAKRVIANARHGLSKARRKPLTVKQANIYQWGWQPEARFRVGVCGRRFGKTFLGTEEIQRAYRLAVEQNVHPDNEIWYGAPSFKQAKRVFWRRLKRTFPRQWVAGKPNETDCSITTTTGHVIRIVGLDNYEDLRGSGLWFFIADEWADAKLLCWTEVIRPMLATSGGSALFIGTPKGFNHFYTMFLDGCGKVAGWKSFVYTTVQGGNVPQDEIDEARRTLDPKTYRQEWEATFESYSGRVYYTFSRVEHVGTLAETAYDPNAPIHVGMDFNINPMSATVWQERNLPGRATPLLVQIDELLIPTSDTDEMCRELKARYGRPSFEPGVLKVDHISVYPDPAGVQRRTSAGGRTDISILTDAGFNVVALRSHPLVRDRISFVNRKFKSADEQIHVKISPKCTFSIESYERLAYKEGTSEPDKTLTYEGRDSMTLDHISDCTGYYIFARFGQAPLRIVESTHWGR
jgi:hypothetical protein